jgi:hypothetical protein
VHVKLAWRISLGVMQIYGLSGMRQRVTHEDGVAGPRLLTERVPGKVFRRKDGRALIALDRDPLPLTSSPRAQAEAAAETEVHEARSRICRTAQTGDH